eukprot:GGOE01046420.1.p1 GENE.GGOE01046420.1~~GGOE01046420.1.p1  ORF type:complete len:376 (-),score=46.26 GGOE01046420.1:278-1372(-)
MAEPEDCRPATPPALASCEEAKGKDSDGVELADQYDERRVRIRQDVKGPWNAGWERRKWNRKTPQTDDVELRRYLQKSVPWWALTSPEPPSVTILQPTYVPTGGYSSLVDGMMKEIRRDISDLSPFRDHWLSPTPIAPEVSSRFMETLELLAAKGVRPRILYHGTSPENLDSIHTRGLLPPSRLAPGEPPDSDAIWTATNPQTCVHHCRGGNVIFGCAVLDGALRDKPPLGAVLPTNHESQGGMRKKFHRNHRQTRKPATGPTGKKSPPSIAHLDDWAVLVRDEALICPCVEITWTLPRDRGHSQVPLRNQNTQREDHARQTLAEAYRNATRYQHKSALRFARRCTQRSRDVERRQLRAAKCCF